MAPGVFCIWSRADPDADSASSEQDDEGLFSDQITSLQGVSRGVRFARSEAQSVEAPFTHEVPFLTMYELADAALAQEDAFKDAVAQCPFKEQDSFRPRIYEQIECIEAEEFKGVVGELVSVVTGEGFAEDAEEEFWKFHREEFVGSFMLAPEFIRGQVFKMVGDVSPTVKTDVPTGPYMFIYHWDCSEIPWTEVIAAAQTKGYVRHIESGIKWQGLTYNPVRFSEVQPPRPHRDIGSGYGSDGEEEDLNGVAGSDTDADDIDADDIAADDRRDSGATRSRHDSTELEDSEHQPTGHLSSKTNGVSTANGTSDKDSLRTGNGRIEETKTNGTDPTTTSRTSAQSDADFMSLNGAVNALAIKDEPLKSFAQEHGRTAETGTETNTSPVFASVSVADKIRAWEKNAA